MGSPHSARKLQVCCLLTPWWNHKAWPRLALGKAAVMMSPTTDLPDTSCWVVPGASLGRPASAVAAALQPLCLTVILSHLLRQTLPCAPGARDDFQRRRESCWCSTGVLGDRCTSRGEGRVAQEVTWPPRRRPAACYLSQTISPHHHQDTQAQWLQGARRYQALTDRTPIVTRGIERPSLTTLTKIQERDFSYF